MKPWLLAFLLVGCAHKPPVEIPIEVPVACITKPVVEPQRVTDEQLKRVKCDATRCDQYPKLAGLRIEQDRAYIRELRSAVDGCSALPARAASAP